MSQEEWWNGDVEQQAEDDVEELLSIQRGQTGISCYQQHRAKGRLNNSQVVGSSSSRTVTRSRM